MGQSAPSASLQITQNRGEQLMYLAALLPLTGMWTGWGKDLTGTN